MTTASPNTRVSDLNILIKAVDQFKQNHPKCKVPNGDPEFMFIQVVTSLWLHDAEGYEQVNAYYLWFAAGEIGRTITDIAEDIGVEDVSLFDPFFGALPGIIIEFLALNQGKEVMNYEGLKEYGNALVSDFIK